MVQRAALTDRVILVTGSTSGIGRAIAHRLAKDGAAVVINGRDEERVHQVAEEINELGGLAVEAPGDVTKDDDAEVMVMTAVGAYGRLDSVVNNAGDALRDRPLGDTSPEEWDHMMEVNLRSVWRVTRRAIEEMRRCGEGHVLNIASNLGLVALPGMAAYIAAKGAVISLTRSMAVDLGREGIRVNAICPGLVATPLTEQLEDFAGKKQSYEEHAALGRIGTPEDVAGLAAFLLGPEASWITGQAVVADGGYTIQ